MGTPLDSAALDAHPRGRTVSRTSEMMAADFAMGGAAAVLAKSAAAPVERVKLLLQNQGELLKRGHLKRPYKGIGDCFSRILREEDFSLCGGVIRPMSSDISPPRKTLYSDGFAGLYRGFGVSIVGITLYRGLYFGIYDTMKPIVLVGPFEGNFVISFLLGWIVTTFSGVCAYPFDTLRRRMMMTSGHPCKYQSAFHAFEQIVKHEGFLVLFRGVGANMLSGIAGAGVLAGYDQLHRAACRHGYGFES
ncbi:hypothetical protein HPP92_019741 [Vanilla planifolia]|uniref:ADP/ATP translocase n=1 Tax=Vanilla planifolia TaxID=51239 RepID=A0A835UJ73_VANPL|nr:hypothetical protein HPP92_019741 [Vanilla planifolia]